MSAQDVMVDFKVDMIYKYEDAYEICYFKVIEVNDEIVRCQFLDREFKGMFKVPILPNDAKVLSNNDYFRRNCKPHIETLVQKDVEDWLK
jgi:hypothetical protein